MVSEKHLELAKIMLEAKNPQAALQVLAYGAIPLNDETELKDVLLAKLMHIKNQKPYLQAGKQLFKALDDIAPFLQKAHANIKKPIFSITDREALIKGLNKSPLWVRFDVRDAVAYVTKKEVKENVVGRQDLVLAIVFAKKPTKNYAKIFLAHLDALHGKLLTFGYNFFHSLPEQNEQEGRPFAWQIDLDEAGQFYEEIFAAFACNMVADHATHDFKGTAQELCAELLKRVKAEGKTLFDANAEMYVGNKRNKDKAYQDFIANSYKIDVSFISGDWSRMHVRDQRMIKDLEQNGTYDIEISVR